MKKLQNNYTTQEQSKRLLELGVPEWTADCYFEKCTGDICIIKKGTFSTFCDKNEVPCWSVGRLIEIYHICVGPGCSFTFHVCFPNLMNEIMYKFGEANSNGWLNLKKLEE